MYSQFMMHGQKNIKSPFWKPHKFTITLIYIHIIQHMKWESMNFYSNALSDKHLLYFSLHIFSKCLSLFSRKNGYKLVEGFESFEHPIQNLLNNRQISQYSNFLPRAWKLIIYPTSVSTIGRTVIR